jgi:hypothetical protein
MTQLLLKLLGAKIDAAVEIARVSLAFRGVGAGWVVFGILALGTLAFLSYQHSPQTVAPARRYTLTTLRTVFLLLILLLLLRPVLAFTVEGSIRRLLVVLVDQSASMQIKDPRVDPADQKRAAIGKDYLDPVKGLHQALDKARAKEVEQLARVEIVKSVLRNDRLNLLSRLDQEFDLAAFTFGPSVAELSSRKEEGGTSRSAKHASKASVDPFPWVDSLEAKGALTAIGDSLREVLNRKRGQPLAGIVLVTDGAHNSGSPPREAAAVLRQERVPLYIYGVGITSPRDIIVGNVFAPDVTFVKDEFNLTVRVRSQGLQGETARLVVSLGDQRVEKEITFAGDGEQVVLMKLTPARTGEFDLTASIEPRPDEAVRDNNSRSQRLKVIDAKIKVLFVDQSPRWEFRYLQAMLLRDRRVELKCWLAEGDPAIARGTNSPYLDKFPRLREELSKYDLMIFGDVDPRAITAQQLDNIGEWVSKLGGALVSVAGRRFNPSAYRRSPLEKMLPVEVDTPAADSSLEGLADKPVRLDLTAAGRASPMLRLSDKEEESAALWKQLPPVYWVARVSRPKPAAEVLLVDPDPAKESRFGKMPVLAMQKYGLGQVLYVGTDNTWRWRKNVGDTYYTALWGQIGQRLSLQHLLGGSKKTQLTTDRQNYITGDRVSLFARLYNDNIEPVTEPAVKGIFGPSAGGQKNEVTLRPIPEQPGLYRGEFIAPSPGAYQFFVERDLDVPLDFNVTEPKFELGETAMNEALLRDLASLSGGQFFREEDLHKLPDTIRAQTDRVRSPLEVELWSSPLYFLVLLTLVTAEWVLRKICYLK